MIKNKFVLDIKIMVKDEIFNKRFSQLDFPEEIKMNLNINTRDCTSKPGDIIFIDQHYIKKYPIKELLEKYTKVYFVASKFSRKNFEYKYSLGISDILYQDFIDEEVLNKISSVYATIKNKFDLELFNQIMDKTTNTIAITDDNGNIEYVNKAFINATGYKLEELIGENPRLLKSGEQPDSLYDELWNKITQNQTWTGDFINCDKEGDYIYEEAVISPVLLEGEMPQRKYVKIANNITKEKFLENKIKMDIALAKNIVSHMAPVTSENNEVTFDYFIKYSNELGGDLVWFEEIKSGEYQLILVDITGHDLSSALILMMIATIINQEAKGEGIRTIVKKINNLLYSFNDQGENLRFATGLFLEIDLNMKTVKYINAGHPSGMIIDKVNKIHRLKNRGMMLGIEQNQDYLLNILPFENIDSIVLYSDGALDNLTKDYEKAEEKLEKFIIKHLKKHPKALATKFFNCKVKNQPLIDDTSMAQLSFKH